MTRELMGLKAIHAGWMRAMSDRGLCRDREAAARLLW